MLGAERATPGRSDIRDSALKGARTRHSARAYPGAGAPGTLHLLEGLHLTLERHHLAGDDVDVERHRLESVRADFDSMASRGEGERLMWARLEPFEGYKLTFEIEFHHPAVDQTGQRVTFDMGSGNYKREIARARTFGFSKDVDMMRARGLGLGGSMDNVIVVDESKVLNAEGLRYDDEFVKHKILDAIGDLHVAGRPMLAHYTAYKSGHALNNKLLRQLLADKDAWETVTFDDAKDAPAGFAELAPAW